DRVLLQYQVDKWSFDKGYFSKENKELLSLFVPNVVMPKKGKLNKNEYQEEHQKEFKKYRNKHSAVESNINELSYRGLDRCPDSGRTHFNNYVALGISAYNLHKIGAELLKQGRIKERLKKAA
ncbi:MAG: ISNCY family transposase, partial [Bacteroidales bacterium]|nr:ISNCY family transposase [Bacteroidales bacterium]